MRPNYIGALLIAMMSASTTAADEIGARQRITVTAPNGHLTIATMTNTRTPTPFPDFGTWVGISKDNLQGLLSGRLKECVWEFPESATTDASKAPRARNWCK